MLDLACLHVDVCSWWGILGRGPLEGLRNEGVAGRGCSVEDGDGEGQRSAIAVGGDVVALSAAAVGAAEADLVAKCHNFCGIPCCGGGRHICAAAAAAPTAPAACGNVIGGRFCGGGALYGRGGPPGC